MVSFMLEGGPFTWAVLALLLCGGFLTLLRAILARHVDFPAAGFCLTGLLMGVGLLGTFQGWNLAFDAVAHASADMKLELMQAGVDMGWHSTTLALIGVVALAPINGIALARSRNRATWMIKALGWVCGSLSSLTALLGWALAIWLAGSLASLGGMAGGDEVTLSVATQAQTLSIALMVGVFLGLLATLLGLGGGVTLLVAGSISGFRNRKKHLEDEEEI
jgi:hypothetical protein